VRSLFLVGMMGSGKSTVGRALASRLARPFVDTDHEIESRAGKSIARIFADEGEPAFRAQEARVIADLAVGDPIVAALGGGAIAQPGAPERLGRLGVVIYLRASPEQLLKRVGDGEKRPLLRGLSREQRLARLGEFAAAREASYLTARIVVDTDGEAVAQVVSQIVDRLVDIEGADAPEAGD
jgi:shikimate kinase